MPACTLTLLFINSYCSYKDVTSLHRAHCHLPSLAAYLLSNHTHLVSAACHALHDRSPADVHACRHMYMFSPARHGMVTTCVTFARLHYARLLQAKFSPPPGVGFNIPKSSKFKEYDLGMKLVSAYKCVYKSMSQCGDGKLGAQGFI